MWDAQLNSILLLCVNVDWVSLVLHADTFDLDLRFFLKRQTVCVLCYFMITVCSNTTEGHSLIYWIFWLHHVNSKYCVKQPPSSNHCLRTSANVASNCRHCFQELSSNLVFIHTVIPIWFSAKLDPPPHPLPLTLSEQSYCGMCVCDGLAPSLINWRVWLFSLCSACRTEAFHSNPPPEFRPSLCLHLRRHFSDIPCWWFNGHAFVCSFLYS